MPQQHHRDVEIPVSQLTLGMQVVELDRPWEETNFLYQGFTIRSLEDIDQLRKQCRTVRIRVRVEQVAEGRRSATARSAEIRRPKPEERIHYVDQVSFREGVQASRLTFDEARDFSLDLLDRIRSGRGIDFQKSRKVVEQVVHSVLENKDALRFLSQIKNKDHYTAEHSVSVCILTAALCRRMGMDELDIRRAAQGGLLHDVGKAKVPIDILNKPGRLSREEALEMARHPEHGRNLLMGLPATERHAIDIAHTHHERLDGTGYPRGLTAEKIPFLSKIITIVDAFDAMTSQRVYGKTRTNREAQEILLKYRGRQFDEEIATEFVGMIGIHPPGTLVRMQDETIGIVVSARDHYKLNPKVLLVAKGEGERLAREKIVDLSKTPADASGRPYQIVSELPNGAFGINLRDYVEKGLQIG